MFKWQFYTKKVSLYQMQRRPESIFWELFHGAVKAQPMAMLRL